MPDAPAPDAGAPPFVGDTVGLKATTRWLLTILAALGAVLVAGLQIGGLGHLESGPRLQCAIAAFAVAFVAVGLLLALAVRVVAMPQISLPGWLEKDTHYPPIPRRWDWFKLDDPNEHLRYMYETVLLHSRFKRISDLAAWREQVANDQSASPETRASAVTTTTYVLDSLYSSQVRRAFRMLLRYMYLLGLLIAASIGVFSWAINPPASEATVASTPVAASLFQQPQKTTLYLTSSGLTQLQTALGQPCAANRMPVIVLAVGNGYFDILILPHDGCAIARVSISQTDVLMQPATTVTFPTATPSQ